MIDIVNQIDEEKELVTASCRAWRPAIRAARGPAIRAAWGTSDDDIAVAAAFAVRHFAPEGDGDSGDGNR